MTTAIAILSIALAFTLGLTVASIVCNRRFCKFFDSTEIRYQALADSYNTGYIRSIGTLEKLETLLADTNLQIASLRPRSYRKRYEASNQYIKKPVVNSNNSENNKTADNA